MLLKANQRSGSDGSPVVSLDGMDSSSIHSTDMTTTPSTTSSPEPFPPMSNHSRPVLTGTAYFKYAELYVILVGPQDRLVINFINDLASMLLLV